MCVQYNWLFHCGLPYPRKNLSSALCDNITTNRIENRNSRILRRRDLDIARAPQTPIPRIHIPNRRALPRKSARISNMSMVPQPRSPIASLARTRHPRPPIRDALIDPAAANPATDSGEERGAGGYECVIAEWLADVFAAFHAAPDAVAVLGAGARGECAPGVIACALQAVGFAVDGAELPPPG